jgi:DNA-binding NarL/FixJ family response regulator
MKKRILLVDDNPSFRRSVEVFLSDRKDVEIVGHANNGLRALEQTQALHPDVILMDLKMPGLNGLMTTKKIKASQNPPTVAIVTLYDNEEYRRAAREVGADAYIVKSEFAFQIAEFLRRLPILETPATILG